MKKTYAWGIVAGAALAATIAVGPVWSQDQGLAGADPLSYIAGQAKPVQGQETLSKSAKVAEQESGKVAAAVDAIFIQVVTALKELADETPTPFPRYKISLSDHEVSWPVSAFLADGTWEGPEQFDEGILNEVRQSGIWIADRTETRHVVVAVAGKSGNVLFVAIPHAFFNEAMVGLGQMKSGLFSLFTHEGQGVGGVGLDPDEHDLLMQADPAERSTLFTSKSLVSLAGIPSTGWRLVIRYPIEEAKKGLSRPVGVPATLARSLNVSKDSKGLKAEVTRQLSLLPFGLGALVLGVSLLGFWRNRRKIASMFPSGLTEQRFWANTVVERSPLNVMSPSSYLDEDPGFVKEAMSLELEIPERVSEEAALHSQAIALLRKQVHELERAVQAQDVIRLIRELGSQVTSQREWAASELRKLGGTQTQRSEDLSTQIATISRRYDEALLSWQQESQALDAKVHGLIEQYKLGAEEQVRIETTLANFQEKVGQEFDLLAASVQTILESVKAFREHGEATDRDVQGALAETQDAVKAQAEGLERLESKLKSEVDGLIGLLDAGDTALKALSSQVLSELPALRAAYETDLAEAKDEAARLGERVESLAEHLVGLETALSTYSQKALQRFDDHDELFEFLNTAIELRPTHDEVNGLLKHLEDRLDEVAVTAERLAEGMVDKMSKLSDRQASMDQQVVDVASHAEALDNRLDAVVEHGEGLEQRLDASEQLGQFQATTISEMMGTLTRLEEELQAAVDGLDSHQEVFRAEVQRWQEALSTLSDQGTELMQAVESSQHTMADELADTLRQINQRIEHAQEANASMIDRLQHQVDGFESQVETAIDRAIEGLKVGIAESSRTLAGELEAKVARVLSHQHTQVGQALSAIDSLRFELAQRDAENRQLQETLAALNAKLGSQSEEIARIQASQSSLAARVHSIVVLISKSFRTSRIGA